MRLSQDENDEKSMMGTKAYRACLENYIILNCYRKNLGGEDRELRGQYVRVKDGMKTLKTKAVPTCSEISLSEFFRLW
jgi:hypothetical protein